MSLACYDSNASVQQIMLIARPIYRDHPPNGDSVMVTGHIEPKRRLKTRLY